MTRWIVAALLCLAPSLVQAGLVRPVPEAVIDNGNGTYDAVFGALNTNATTQVIPYGASNFFAPAPLVRGQPTTFAAGQANSVFTLTFDGTPLTWSLGGFAVTVDSTGILNDPGVVMPLLDGVFDYGNGSYAASFGYRFVDQNVSQFVTPLGASNFFSPAPAVRGQPTVFQFGTHYAVFTVLFDGADITWNVTGPDGVQRSVTANAGSPPLDGDPFAIPEPAALAIFGAGLAAAGLLRRRRALETQPSAILTP